MLAIQREQRSHCTLVGDGLNDQQFFPVLHTTMTQLDGKDHSFLLVRIDAGEPVILYCRSNDAFYKINGPNVQYCPRCGKDLKVTGLGLPFATQWGPLGD